MFDINISLGGLFSGCFPCNKEQEIIDDYAQLKLSLKRVDEKTKIQMILAKITNGKHHSSFLFHFTSERTFEITDFYGQEQHQVDSELLCRNIPLMDRNQVVSVLCVRSEKLGDNIKVPEELIQLLTDIVVKQKI